MKIFVSLVLMSMLALGFPVKPEPALGETKTGTAIVDLCGRAKDLIDKVAVVILNDSPPDAFDQVINNVLNELCSLRKAAEPDPLSMQLVQDLGVGVLGWAWDVSTLMKFKAERNSVAADIAAKGVKRRITALQLLCPKLVVPDVASIP